MTPRLEQFSGCLIGQCLGDALGCPVEGFPTAHCQSYVKGFLRSGLAGSFGRGTFPFGQYTDDSQLARELLQSYVACGRFDPTDYARRIETLFTERRVVGPGRATAEAARRLARGVRWDEAGTAPPAAGNGSAMRAGPIGLLFYDYSDRLIEAACDQGRITHLDTRCSAGAVAIAGAVALALQDTPIVVADFITRLSEWAGRIEPTVASGIRQLTGWVALPPEEAVRLIAVHGLEGEQATGWEGISPFVTNSVLWSLYAFLRTPGEYWETICTAIGGGGDADTTAAMAGAISGAHLGLNAIPHALAGCLTDQGTWRFTELVELAHQAYELRMQP